MSTWKLVAVVLCGVAGLVVQTGGQTAAAEVRFQKQDDRVDVTLDGKPFTSYIFSGYAKPILYPVIGPDGVPMTRSFPVEKGVEGEANDHPHHESLWFTHDEVNGVDFWAHKPDDEGRTPRIVQKSMPVCEDGVILTDNAWTAPDGQVVLTDTRRYVFAGDADQRTIDIQVVLHASEGDVHFGDTKEGTMAIRVRTPLQLKDSSGSNGAAGHIRTSEGLTDAEAWGKRARWVDYFGEVEGAAVGVAIFDHPENLRHPARWHARDYGLFTANPFGVKHFTGNDSEPGGYTLPAGEDLTLRYRFVFHGGDVDVGVLDSQWKAWAGR
ncbi:MAG: PmoA family protein [Pirellulales bacterium]|jgi:hypothetical protein|nr:PmoA family protein [Pirellulales bacterium]